MAWRGGRGPLAAVGAFAALSLATCRSSEEELSERFLEATVREDHPTVAQLSMVAFPVAIRGFRLLGVSKPTREAYRVPMLRQRVADAENARDRQFEEFGNFRNQNYDDLARIQRLSREQPTVSFTGRMAELQREWEAYREERRTLVESLHLAQQELEQEIRTVTKSLQRESTPEYLTGETIHEQARVRVTTSGGDEPVYVLVLTRYDLKNQFGAAVPTRWIITGIFPETS